MKRLSLVPIFLLIIRTKGRKRDTCAVRETHANLVVGIGLYQIVFLAKVFAEQSAVGRKYRLKLSLVLKEFGSGSGLYSFNYHRVLII